MLSVIIPTYNRASTLGRALESVLRQTHTDFEIIVVDDGSEDNTEEIVKKLNSDHIVFLRTDHSGVCTARNKGIQAAKGKYITFLDSDDEVDKTWLESFHGAFLGSPGAGLVFCGARIIGNNRSGPNVKYPKNLGLIFRNQTGFVLAGSFAVQTDIIRKNGGYDEALAHSENTELILRLIAYCSDHNYVTIAINEPNLIYHAESKHPDESYYAERAAAAVHIIEKHRRLLESDNKSLATYYSIAGVNLARLRKNSHARSFLLKALKVQPAKIKHFARFLLMFLPPLARFVWKKH